MHPLLQVGVFLATDYKACVGTVILIVLALLVHFFLFKGERLKRDSEWLRALNCEFTLVPFISTLRLVQSTKIAQILVDGMPQVAEKRRAVGGRVQPTENK